MNQEEKKRKVAENSERCLLMAAAMLRDSAEKNHGLSILAEASLPEIVEALREVPRRRRPVPTINDDD
jgi:hypothetical protein